MQLLQSEAAGMYGLEIVDASKRGDTQRVSRGSVYVLLARLEDKGFVKKTTPSKAASDHPGLPRPVYKLTAEGMRVIAGRSFRLQSERKFMADGPGKKQGPDSERTTSLSGKAPLDSELVRAAQWFKKDSLGLHSSALRSFEESTRATREMMEGFQRSVDFGNPASRIYKDFEESTRLTRELMEGFRRSVDFGSINSASRVYKDFEESTRITREMMEGFRRSVDFESVSSARRAYEIFEEDSRNARAMAEAFQTSMDAHRESYRSLAEEVVRQAKGLDDSDNISADDSNRIPEGVSEVDTAGEVTPEKQKPSEDVIVEEQKRVAGSAKRSPSARLKFSVTAFMLSQRLRGASTPKKTYSPPGLFALRVCNVLMTSDMRKRLVEFTGHRRYAARIRRSDEGRAGQVGSSA